MNILFLKTSSFCCLLASMSFYFFFSFAVLSGDDLIFRSGALRFVAPVVTSFPRDAFDERGKTKLKVDTQVCWPSFSGMNGWKIMLFKKLEAFQSFHRLPLVSNRPAVRSICHGSFWNSKTVRQRCWDANREHS